jgi:hypothetical protein
MPNRDRSSTTLKGMTDPISHPDKITGKGALARFKRVIRPWLKSLGTPPGQPAMNAAAFLELVITQLSARPATGQRVILYARAATHSGEQREAALKGQLQSCREWAEAHGCRVIGEYKDTVNGLAGDAPGLSQALDRAQTEKAALVCLSPDRLSRSVALNLKRAEECRQHGVALYFLK